jgi:transcriptional regulator with XRE-family HTH domain
MTIGKAIREARIGKGMSLQDLGKEISCSAPFISDIESGKRYPKAAKRDKIALALGLDSRKLESLDPRPNRTASVLFCEEDPEFGIALRNLVAGDIDKEEFIRRIS